MCTAPAPEPLCYDSASEVSHDRTAVWGTVSCVGPVPRISWSSLSAMGWAVSRSRFMVQLAVFG